MLVCLKKTVGRAHLNFYELQTVPNEKKTVDRTYLNFWELQTVPNETEFILNVDSHRRIEYLETVLNHF